MKTKFSFAHIIEEYHNGNKLPFNQFFKETYKNTRGRLVTLMKSEVDADDIFSECMHKFYELFIVQGKPVPDTNAEGYIYQMCKNACISSFRKKKRYELVSNDDLKLKNTDQASSTEKIEDNQHWTELEKEDHKKMALTKALGLLGKKCKKLFDKNITEKIKLKNLWEELGYINYQAIVMAKYNCKKELSGIFFTELHKMNQKNGDNT